MGLRFCSLSSSSVHGNSFLVRGCNGTTIMIDCGIRLRRLEALLEEVHAPADSIAALFITHEHVDHTTALRLRHPFAVRHSIPVYAQPEFWDIWRRDAMSELPAELRRDVRPDETVRVGELSVRAVGKPHDTESSIGFVVSDGEESLGLFTDLGHVPDDIFAAASGAEYYIFESNHDVEMEKRSGRPWSLIRRVLGERGHLSNEQCLSALSHVAGPLTRCILLAHLSLECNTPDLARKVVGEGLAAVGYNGALEVAHPNRPSGWLPYEF